MRRLANVLMVVGVPAIVFGTGIYHARVRAGDYEFGAQNPLWAYALLAGLILVACVSLGVPTEPRTVGGAIVQSVAAPVAGSLAFVVIQLFDPSLLPRFVLTVVSVPIGLWLCLCSALARHGWRTQEGRARVLAVVEGEEERVLMADAAAPFPRPELAFTLQGTITPAECVDLSGRTLPLLERARGMDVSVLVLSEQAQQDDAIVAQAAALHAQGVRVRSLEMFYDQWLAKLPLSSVGRMALMTDVGELHGRVFWHTKRVFDVLVALIGIVVLVAVTPIVLVGNLVANRGPLLFRQPRVGRDGRLFSIIKFRTMSPERLDPLMPWTALDDPRITPFGRWLRRSHLDEVPQFVNMLRGDLSLIGPRPEQPHYVEELAGKLPFYDLRHLVQPGLTGWAQVKFRYASTEADALEKLQYDLYYVRHQGLLLDVRILGRTTRSVLFHHGR